MKKTKNTEQLDIFSLVQEEPAQKLSAKPAAKSTKSVKDKSKIEKSPAKLNKKSAAVNSKNIFSDNKKGSSELVLELNTLIKANLKKKEFILDLIKDGKKELKAFAAVQSYLSEVEKLFKKNPLSLSEFVYNFERMHNDTAVKIIRKAKPILKDVNTILTISNSGIVFKVIQELAKEKKNLKVIVCESRPVMEGKLFAKKLLAEGIKTELITEAMISVFIKECDAVISGADVILKNGNFINKTGTKNLAIIAKYSSKPFYVCAEKSKISKGISFDHGVHDSSEVWQHEDVKLKVHNFYFEEIKEDLVTKLITD